MKASEYLQRDGVGLAELVRRGEVQPLELVETALSAIDQVNPALNAVLTTLEDQARQEIASGLPEGPFRGVPFLIKELALHAEGVPCNLGSRLSQGLAFPHDTELMTRFRKAGLVTVGTTNTPELGFNANTAPVLFGPTRNPWNLERSPGGSSGGSAAAVAAGIVPLAHANDGGGSIRVPASACGLFGLKPTRARTPAGPDVGVPLHGLAVELAVTRSVRDAAVLLDAVSGPDAGAPYWAEAPHRPFAEEVGADAGSMRIAVAETLPGHGEPTPEMKEALGRTVKLLEELGHRVEPAAPTYPADAVTLALVRIWSSSIASLIEVLAQACRRAPSHITLESATLAAYQLGKRLSALELEQAFAIMNQLSRAMGAFFATYDVLLTPTLTRDPVPIGELNQNEPRLTVDAWWSKITSYILTPIWNATGHPAASVPLEQSAEGLPLGMQLVGRYADEAALLRLSAQLEEARPWFGKRPPTSFRDG